MWFRTKRYCNYVIMDNLETQQRFKPKTEKRNRIYSNTVELKENKIVTKKRKMTSSSPRIKKGRISMKKIDRGIVWTICQDDISQGNIVLQLEWGRTHLLHFGCLKEWIRFKLEWPSWRTDLQKLYQEKIIKEARENGISEHDEYWYPEDLIPLKRAKENMIFGK